jgi:hypothetical protein
VLPNPGLQGAEERGIIGVVDHTRENYTALFDALLKVLGTHQNEQGAGEAWAYLRSARFCYAQQDMDHMVGNLVLALDSLARVPRNSGLWDQLLDEVRRFVAFFSRAPGEMRTLAEEYEANGGDLLSRDQILEEVSERRGALR